MGSVRVKQIILHYIRSLSMIQDFSDFSIMCHWYDSNGAFISSNLPIALQFQRCDAAKLIRWFDL